MTASVNPATATLGLITKGLSGPPFDDSALSPQTIYKADGLVTTLSVGRRSICHVVWVRRILAKPGHEKTIIYD